VSNSINPLIPAIFAVVGTIIGALIGGIVPNIMQNRTAYKSFRRSKLEELYDDLNRWINASFSFFIINFSFVLKKEIDWNKYLDLNSKADSNKETKFFKSEIIINLYFKELIQDFINLIESIREIRRIIDNEIKQTYLAGEEILTYLSDYNGKVNNMNALAEKLMSHIKTMAINI